MKKLLLVGYTTIYLIVQCICLFFILPLCFLNIRIFNWTWDKYYMRPLPKNIFNLCVQWLLYVGHKVGLSYESINVLIFCIVWPVITISSIILNIFMLCKQS